MSMIYKCNYYETKLIDSYGGEPCTACYITFKLYVRVAVIGAVM